MLNLKQTHGHVHDEGDVHLPSSDANHDTLCGQGDPGQHYEPTSAAATCPYCLAAAEELWQLLSAAKRSKRWLK